MENTTLRSTLRRPTAGARAQRGFTLIELMIALVILAILTSIAMPGYRQYILRSHRVEAQAALMNLAASQEKYYLVCNSYTTDVEGATDVACDAGRGLGFPDFDGDVAGVQTENGWYTIEVDDADADAYSATLTAIGSQADDADCSTLSLDSSGHKSAENDKCWD